MDINRKTRLLGKKRDYRRKSVKKYSATGVAAMSAISALSITGNADLQLKAEASTISAHQFIQNVATYATDIAGQNDLYASVMIAQASLESGWGNSGLAKAPNYNLFGIKGNYNGQSAYVPTLEDDGEGNYYQIMDSFRRYPSYKESLEDYAKVLKTGPAWNSQFYSGTWKSNTTSYQDATNWLTGRYATDTRYASKLNNIIQTYNLTQYDTLGQETSTNDTKVIVASSSQENKNIATGSYTVKAGDGLWRIAQSNGMTLSELKSLNGLTSDTIHPGQILKVTGQATEEIKEEVVVIEETPTTENKDMEIEVKEEVVEAIEEVFTDNLIENETEVKIGTYTVKAGDGLWRVAQSHGLSVSQLKTLNGLTSNLIHPGQVLRISDKFESSVPAVSKSTTPAKLTPTTASTTTGTYTVKAGDGLWRIAQNHGLSVSQLKVLNGLTSDLVHPGQRLKVSGTTQSSTTLPTVSKSTAATTASTTTDTYTVKAGDGLWRVAQNHGLSVSQLKSLNDLTSDTIHPGQVLKVSGKFKSSVPTVSKTATVEITSTPTTTNDTYTVKSGDGLWSIAQRHGLSVSQLKSLNGLTSELIGVGQILKVSGTIQASTPTPAASQTTTPAVVDQASSSTTGLYTVKSGDNLWRIAQNHGISLAHLKALNGLTSDAVHVGQVLKTSGTVQVTPTAVKTVTPIEVPEITPETEEESQVTSNQVTTYYTVEAGDTMYSIARRSNCSLASLLSENGVTSYDIYPGQILAIPSK